MILTITLPFVTNRPSLCVEQVGFPKSCYKKSIPANTFCNLDEGHIVILEKYIHYSALCNQPSVCVFFSPENHCSKSIPPLIFEKPTLCIKRNNRGIWVWLFSSIWSTFSWLPEVSPFCLSSLLKKHRRVTNVHFGHKPVAHCAPNT